MKEEIEEEFYAGQHEEFKEGNDDCIERQRFLYLEEREIGEIHCFILFRRPVRYIRRRRNGEREGKKEEKREREREIGENYCFIVFSLLFSWYTSKKIWRESVLEILRTVHIR